MPNAQNCLNCLKLSLKLNLNNCKLSLNNFLSKEGEPHFNSSEEFEHVTDWLLAAG